MYISAWAIWPGQWLGLCPGVAPTDNIVWIEGLKHPAVSHAVGNSIMLEKNTNMLFLTGANMAGKSTFMKAFGVSVYLAHMGFPVAATEMAFSVRDGLFSSINVADDLSQGHSHFYAEVLRVKKVAQAVSEGKRLVVLFDELFKGTNVKDAYDGTLAVTDAFSRYRRCAFIISTHIVEAGEALRKRRDNLRFAYLPTVLENGRPRYPYILQEGIAADRVGMMIIENEGIIDIIKK
jgi:DNA mismatch repair protein MutS